MPRRDAIGALALAGLAALAPSPGGAAAGPSIFGTWARGDGKAAVRIERCGADLCAVNTWVRAGTRGEKAGDRLVMSVAPEGDGRWSGTAFDPQRDLTIRMTIAVGARTMTSRGCVVAGLLCRNMGWTRLSGE